MKAHVCSRRALARTVPGAATHHVDKVSSLHPLIVAQLTLSSLGVGFHSSQRSDLRQTGISGEPALWHSGRHESSGFQDFNEILLQCPVSQCPYLGFIYSRSS